MSRDVVEPRLSCEDCGKPIERGDHRPLDLMRVDPAAAAGKNARAGGRRFRVVDLCRRCAGIALMRRAWTGGSVCENGKKRVLRTTERVPPKRGGRPRLLNDRQLRAAHAVYRDGNLTMIDLAARLKEAGYPGTVAGLASSLRLGWQRLQLPQRPVGESIWIARRANEERRKTV